jgi:hypothetical protein
VIRTFPGCIPTVDAISCDSRHVNVIVTVNVDAVVDGDGDGDVIDVIGKAW